MPHQRLAKAVNAELPRLYWRPGQRRLYDDVLRGERAVDGAQVINQLGDQLAQEFGRSLVPKNRNRMVKIAAYQGYLSRILNDYCRTRNAKTGPQEARGGRPFVSPAI